MEDQNNRTLQPLNVTTTTTTTRQSQYSSLSPIISQPSYPSQSLQSSFFKNMSSNDRLWKQNRAQLVSDNIKKLIPSFYTTRVGEENEDDVMI